MSEWEHVGAWADRLPVPGGWLYRVETHTFPNRPDADGFTPEVVAVSVVFVPDPQKETP